MRNEIRKMKVHKDTYSSDDIVCIYVLDFGVILSVYEPGRMITCNNKGIGNKTNIPINPKYQKWYSLNDVSSMIRSVTSKNVLPSIVYKLQVDNNPIGRTLDSSTKFSITNAFITIMNEILNDDSRKFTELNIEELSDLVQFGLLDDLNSHPVLIA